MEEIEIQVRPATLRDQGRILTLLDRAHRRHIAFGPEDLSSLLGQPAHVFVLADAGSLLWGIACATVRPRPAAPDEAHETVWGHLRGLALINGWHAEIGVWTLMEGLRLGLQARQAQYLVAYVTQLWMEMPLAKVGLRPVEYILTYERMANALPKLPPPPDVRLRSARPEDVSRLTALDTAAFTSLWRLTSGELIELLITSGRFVVAEREDNLVGYACSDVQRNLGQIYRLVVHPVAQGQGIGRALLADALLYCQAAGASLVIINTQQSNQVSDHLYRSFGFRPASQRIPVMVGEVTGQTDPTA